jgi:acyl-coenzyme A thioesterase PaaI-like protein
VRIRCGRQQDQSAPAAKRGAEIFRRRGVRASDHAAIDTVASLAMMTGDRPTKGTIYQHTHFLRPAKDDDFIVEAEVLRFGKATAYAETSVRLATYGELVAHAVTPRRLGYR